MTTKAKKPIEICRLCTNCTEFTNECDLFAKCNKTLVQQIQDITGITLREMSRLNYPRLICFKCKKDLIYSHEFRCHIIKSQSYFKSKDYQNRFDDLSKDSKKEEHTKMFDSVFIPSLDDKDETLHVKSFSDESSGYEDNNLTAIECDIRTKNVDNKDLCQNEINEQSFKKSTNINSESLRITRQRISHEKNNKSENMSQNVVSFATGNENSNIVLDDIASSNSSVENNDIEEADYNEDESGNSSFEEFENPNDPDFKYTEQKCGTSKEKNEDFEGLNCNQLTCHHCEMSFKSYDLIKSHWHKKHKGLKRLIKCELCVEKFPTLKSLNRHARLHKGEKLYKCHFCDESFDHSITRSRHERRKHSKDWPFLCAICGKAFISHQSGKDHMTVHTKERAFHCTVCKASFLRKRHLITHYRSETHKNNEKKLIEERPKTQIRVPDISSQTNYCDQDQVFLNVASYNYNAID